MFAQKSLSLDIRGPPTRITVSIVSMWKEKGKQALLGCFHLMHKLGDRLVFLNSEEKQSDPLPFCQMEKTK